jgi:hypothetical protein
LIETDLEALRTAWERRLAVWFEGWGFLCSILSGYLQQAVFIQVRPDGPPVGAVANRPYNEFHGQGCTKRL